MSLVLRGLTTRLGHIIRTANELSALYSGGHDNPSGMTGITKLHHFEFNDDLIGLASETVLEALTRARLAPSDIGGLVATSNFSHKTLIPTLGPAVAERAGFARMRAVTIGIGCGGLAQAVEYAMAMMTSSQVSWPRNKQFVILAAEHYSRQVDHNDLKTRYLFSDGIAAFILMDTTPLPGDLILCEAASWSLTVAETLSGLKLDNAAFSQDVYFRMETPAVVRFTHTVLEQARQLLDLESWHGISIIPHQANSRLLAHMEAGVQEAASFYKDGIISIGNTLNASTLFALEDALKRHILGSEDVVLVPFGAEWTVGAIRLQISLPNSKPVVN